MTDLCHYTLIQSQKYMIKWLLISTLPHNFYAESISWKTPILGTESDITKTTKPYVYQEKKLSCY